jgi:hypothetical protein
MRFLIATALTAVLVACGGGGSDSGSAATTPPPPPPPPPPASTASLQMNASGVSVSAYAENLAPQPVTVTATLVNPPTTNLSYKVVTSGTAIASSTFSWQSSQNGSLIINFQSPATLGAGTYTGSVQLSVCADSACTQPINDSPATVTVVYVVNPGSQPPTSFTIQASGITSPLFTSQTTPTDLSFYFYVTNFPTSGLWVLVRQPTGGPVTSAAFENVGGPTFAIGATLKSPATLGPGIYTDSLSFSLCYDAACENLVPGSPMTIPLDFTVSATAGIEYSSNPITLPGASSVAWNAANQELYATTLDGGPIPDSLVQVNPTTGTVGPSLALSVTPTQLALSSDGQYAYVASQDEPTIYRVALPSLTADLQIPLGSGQNGTNTVYQMAVAPGAPHTLAVSFDSGGSTEYTSGIAVFDDAAQRTNVLGPLNSFGSPAPIAWGDTASTLFALRIAQSSGPTWLSELDSVSVTASGLALASAFPVNLETDPLNAFRYAAGRLYGNDAIVRDASTGATLGQFAIPSGYQVITLMPDPANSRVVFLTHDGSSSHLVLLCYDAASFAMTSLADLGYDNSGGYGITLTLWGTNGLAFDYGGDQVMVLAGAFVPQSAGARHEAAVVSPESRGAARALRTPQQRLLLRHILPHARG